MQTMQKARILVVEDESIIALDLSTRLERMGHSVVGTAATGASALAQAASTQPDLVLMDIVLQGPINGIETARRLAEVSDVPVIYLTSHADDATVRSAVGTEPFGYVLKPFNERELQAAIQIALFKHNTEAKLRKMERWLTATVSSMGDGVITTDREGRITLINALAQRLTGWSDNEALGRSFGEVFNVIDGRTRQPLEDLLGRALREGFNIGLDDHIVLITRAGQEIPVDDSIAPIRDASGQASGIVIVFRDGSARQMADEALHALQQEIEQRVQQRTEQLQESHRAMNAFCLSVTHDLRTPLFALSGFSSILSDRYASALDAEGRQFLSMIQKKSLQMGGMIDDFLRLAGLRQAPLRSLPIDSDAMVRDVCADLAAQYPSARNIVLEPLPRMVGDPGLIRQVWANLIGNALKFSARQADPQVRVSGEVTGDDVAFHVQDNGTGFDPSQAGRLFGMFQRLHADADYSGSGIGLATVAAVVHRHGGSIRAEGEPGRGATFHFVLPREPARTRPLAADVA